MARPLEPHLRSWFAADVSSTRSGEPERKWKVLKEWSGGTGLIRTESFTTTSDSWRVSWQTGAGDPDPIGSITVQVRRSDGRLVKLASNLGQKVDAGTVPVHAAPGEYYLEIEGADRKWHLAVEQ